MNAMGKASPNPRPPKSEALRQRIKRMLSRTPPDPSGHIHPPGHFCGSNCPMYRKPLDSPRHVEPLRELRHDDTVRVFVASGSEVVGVQLQPGARYRLFPNGRLYNEHGTYLGQFQEPVV